MKLELLLINVIIASGCMNSTSKYFSDRLYCNDQIVNIENIIKNNYNADSVIIYKKKLQEEAYFDEIRCPVVVIINATTKSLNFKMLPLDKYQRFENYELIGANLKVEAKPIAELLIKNCDMSEFNDLIIEFSKRDNEGTLVYRFICHYKELLSNKN